MSRSHVAGAAHADVGSPHPAFPATWLRPPRDVNDLLPQLWPRTVARAADGELAVGGVRARELAAEHGTPAYVVDEADFRARAREFAVAFDEAFAGLCGGADVYYAGKAFLCTEVARWVHAEGLRLDTCTGGELAVGLRAGLPGEALGLHGNNKTDAELDRALAAGIGRIVLDSADEVDRVAAAARRAGAAGGGGATGCAGLGRRAPVLVRVNVGVEAHTHEFLATAHEDQKFGVALAGGEAARVVADVLARPELDLRGLHVHIGSQIFDTAGFDMSVRRLVRLHADVVRDHGVTLPEVDLGGGFGMAYTSADDPLPASELARRLARAVGTEFAAVGLAVPRVSVEPGRAIAGPSTFTLYEVGTVKPVRLDGGVTRTYVSVDGGMSDNVRTALYDADYSATLASRASSAAPVLARVVGRHCEAGDVVVRDEFLPGDVQRGDLVAVPGTGAYCRSLSSQYNHTPRPPVVAVDAGASRVLVRRETETDLLALDLG